jgi:hypothetical protein
MENGRVATYASHHHKTKRDTHKRITKGSANSLRKLTLFLIHNYRIRIPNSMVKKLTAQQIKERANYSCENKNCPRTDWFYHIHHVYWKSQYRMDDRDELWNLAYICNQCHYSIHNQANLKLDAELKALADERKPKELRSKKKVQASKVIRQARKTSYKLNLERYKFKNGGKTPWRVYYERSKAIKGFHEVNNR